MVREFIRVNRQRILLVGALILGGLFVSANGADTGRVLINDQHGKFWFLELRDNSLAQAKNIDREHGYIHRYINLEKIGKTAFLFESSSNYIGIFDLARDEVIKLFDGGGCPVYFEDGDSILFTKTEMAVAGYESYLYRSLVNGTSAVKLRNIPLGAGSTCPIKLNEKEAIVYLGKGQYAVLEVMSGTFKEISLQCKPLLSLSNERFLCAKDGSHFVSDIRGTVITQLEAGHVDGKNMIALAYFGEINSLLIQEYREPLFRKSIANLWLLNLDTFKNELVLNDFISVKNGAIYLGTE